MCVRSVHVLCVLRHQLKYKKNVCRRLLINVLVNKIIYYTLYVKWLSVCYVPSMVVVVVVMVVVSAGCTVQS